MRKFLSKYGTYMLVAALCNVVGFAFAYMMSVFMVLLPGGYVSYTDFSSVARDKMYHLSPMDIDIYTGRVYSLKGQNAPLEIYAIAPFQFAVNGYQARPATESELYLSTIPRGNDGYVFEGILQPINNLYVQNLDSPGKETEIRMDIKSLESFKLMYTSKPWPIITTALTAIYATAILVAWFLLNVFLAGLYDIGNR